MKIKDGNYFVVQAWMVTKLNLKGAERDAYAIIYGYSQDEDSDFHGSLDYIAQLTGYSRNAICTALKSLTDKGLLIKSEKIVNNIKYCRYRTSDLYAVQADCTENAKNESKSVQVTLTKNKLIEVNKEIKNKEKGEMQTFISLYHEICNTLPRVKSITDKREKAIQKIIKKYSLEEIKEVFTKTQESDFLQGRNDRKWKADLDFILREDKFINILEGKYDGKAKSVSTEGHLKLDRRVDKQKFREDIASGKAEKF